MGAVHKNYEIGFLGFNGIVRILPKLNAIICLLDVLITRNSMMWLPFLWGGD